MISQITPILQGIEQPDGQTIANARGFTDNDDNGALNVEMGEDWSGDEPVTISSLFYAVSLAANTTYTIDYNGTADEMTMPSVQFENGSGQVQGTPMTGEWDAGGTEYTVTPASFTTPNTAGIYYIHIAYSMDWTTVPLLVAPRPVEYSLASAKHWTTGSGQCTLHGFAVKDHDVLNPILHLPLLENANASFNPKSASISTNGTLVFTGKGATFGTYCNVEVSSSVIFANSFTFGFWFNPSQSYTWHELAFLYGASPSDYSNRTICIVCAHENSHVFNVYSYDSLNNLILRDNKEMPSTSKWHSIFVAIDKQANEIRAVYNGIYFGFRRITDEELDAGGIAPSGAGTLRLGAINGDRGFWGQMRGLKVFNSALSFNQMQRIQYGG